MNGLLPLAALSFGALLLLTAAKTSFNQAERRVLPAWLKKKSSLSPIRMIASLLAFKERVDGLGFHLLLTKSAILFLFSVFSSLLLFEKSSSHLFFFSSFRSSLPPFSSRNVSHS